MTKINIDKSKFDPFNILVVILALVITVCAIYSCAEIFKINSHYHSDEDDLINDAKFGRYGDLVCETYSTKALGYGGEKYKTPYAATDYLNASVFYNAYIRTGDEAAAKPYKAQMDKSYEDMGELKNFFKEKFELLFLEVEEIEDEPETTIAEEETTEQVENS